MSGVRIADITTAEMKGVVEWAFIRLLAIGSALMGKGGMMMADREKVIKGLHCCAHTDRTNCVYCPYDITTEDCTALMSMDVLDLMKEQEQRINELEEKLRLMEYGDQDILQSGMMPAT